ncbi:MAG TPA: acyl-CoA dehydrogenase family protein [Polyangia bacterium]|jgi:glutaryl-CoA dehydrogenase
MSFRGVDYYGIEALLGEDERMVRDTVRAYVEEKVLPLIPRHFRAGTFPVELIPELGRLGLLGTSIKGYGCPGMGPVAYGLVCQELERGDSGVRSFCSVQSSLVMWPIAEYGSEAQKQQWLPRLATGAAIGCFGLTEPDFGSNPTGMRTTARRQGDGYLLNGTKLWITNGSVADVAVVWAKLDGEVRGFLVPRGTPGFSARDIHGKFSLRASVTSELALEDCRVGEDALLPGVKGMRGPLGCLNQARFGIAWGAVGAMLACYDEALAYAKSRVQFAKPIAGYQLTQEKLVGMLEELTKAQLLALQLGRLKESGILRHQQVSLAKRNNVFHARNIARTAREILGANGITDEYQCGRHMCNLESVYTYEGTHEVHTLVVGQDITGIAAFE